MGDHDDAADYAGLPARGISKKQCPKTHQAPLDIWVRYYNASVIEYKRKFGRFSK
jgi:hypothetical protein